MLEELLHRVLEHFDYRFDQLEGKLNMTDQAITDLTSVVSDLGTAVQNETASQAALIDALEAANQSGANDSTIESLVSQLRTSVTTLNANAAAAQQAAQAASTVPAGGSNDTIPAGSDTTVAAAANDTVPATNALGQTPLASEANGGPTIG